MRRPVLGLLGAALVLLQALGVHALPPVITVKGLKTRAGPTYSWKVSSSVSSPFRGPVYPNQTSVARVNVDVQRTAVAKAYVVTGKVIVINPPQTQEPITVTSVRASFGPLLPLLTPLPQQLDCSQQELQPGQSLACHMRLDLPSGVAKTLTPLVAITGSPLLQGEPLQLSWPGDEEAEDGGFGGSSGGGSSSSGEADESACALIQTQVSGGDLQGIMRVTTAKDFEDMLHVGLEVCDERAALAYDVAVGPFDESSGLCGTYTISDAPVLRLAAGSMGSSSISQASLPVTLGGCRPKNILGGQKPAVAISKLTLAQLITHDWAAETVSSTNTSNPATVKWDAAHAVDVALKMQRTVGKKELFLMGEVTVTNTEKLPALLPADGVRLRLSRDGAPGEEELTLAVTCPMVGSSVVVRPQVADTPGTLICEFKAPVDKAWRKGRIQAQLQTLLSAAFDVDSGAPQPYDFEASSAQVQSLHQGECVDLQLTRVTEKADIMRANRNPEVATLAQSLRGDRFKLLPMGVTEAAGADGRVPPTASPGRKVAPLVVCGNKTLAWRETYGPFSEYDCGPNMALMGVSAKPVSGPGEAISTTLAFPIAVKSCTIKPEFHSVEMRPYSKEAYTWSVHQTREPDGDVQAMPHQALPIRYNVRYKRKSSLSGFKVRGLFKVMNPHATTLSLAEVGFTITRPTGHPIKGEASCSGTYEEGYVGTGAATQGSVGAVSQAATQAMMTVQTSISAGAVGASSSLNRQKIKLAAAKTQAQVQVAAVPQAQGGAGAARPAASQDYDYEDGGSGPLFCSLEAEVPDDFPARVQLYTVTDEGAKASHDLGVIDWSTAETVQSNKCSLASFMFSQEGKTLLQPSSIDGYAPPSLAVRICEEQHYAFTANFGPFNAYDSGGCGLRQAIATATVSVPETATVIHAEDTLNIDVVGCAEALPTLTVDASQAAIKGVHTWSLTRRMAAVGGGSHQDYNEPEVTVAGPASPAPKPAFLALAAKYKADAKPPGSYAKFNQTISVKRNKLAYSSNADMFEVKGSVKLVNNGDIPLTIKHVLVKISCEAGSRKPVIVKATCPQHYYGDYSHADSKERPYLTLPTTADRPVKCQFGAIVPHAGKTVVQARAVMADGRKAKAKHNVHLDLLHHDDSEYKANTLGSCIRVRELRQVFGSQTGGNLHKLLTITKGDSIPEDGIEVCKAHSWSFVGRIGPLPDCYAQGKGGCQAVTYESAVEAVPSSGYQGALKNDARVEVRNSACNDSPERYDGAGDSTGPSDDYGYAGGSTVPPLPGPKPAPVAYPPPGPVYTQPPPSSSYTQPPPSNGYTQPPPSSSYTQPPPSSSYTPAGGADRLPGGSGGSSEPWGHEEWGDDGEGSGEGYDDNQKADLWKGHRDSHKMPGLVGGTEKLVTSSVQA